MILILEMTTAQAPHKKFEDKDSEELLSKNLSHPKRTWRIVGSWLNPDCLTFEKFSNDSKARKYVTL